MGQANPEYKTVSYASSKRPQQTHPPLNLLKTIIFAKSQKPPSQILRMSSTQFSWNTFKRPETPINIEESLKIVGHAQNSYRFYNSEVKPQTSQSTLRVAKVLISRSISRSSARGKRSFSSLPKNENMIAAQQEVEVDEVLYRNSAKLQMLYREKQLKAKSMTIILSVEFVLQESRFWRQDEIEEDAIKLWRKLKSIANLVWLVRKQKSLRKLQIFAQRMQIPLDSVCLVRKPKRKKVITINLKLLELEFNLKHQQKVIYVDVLCPDHSVERAHEHYWCKFPVSSLRNISINFLESQQSTKSLFHNIPNLLQKQPESILKIDPILESFQSYLKKYQSERLRVVNLKYIPKGLDESSEEQDVEESILKNLEQLKGMWIKDILNRYTAEGKERMIQKGSIQYTIGDLLKRNFTIMSELKHEAWRHKPQPQTQPALETEHSAGPLRYNNVIFLWKF